MTATATTRLPINTIVTIDDHRCPGLYQITSRGPKNLVLNPVNPDGTRRPGRGARMPDYLVHEVTDTNKATATLIPLAPYTHFTVGSIVTFAGKPGIYVVLADKGERVNIAELGGDNDRYLRAPAAGLTALTLTDLPAALKAGA